MGWEVWRNQGRNHIEVDPTVTPVTNPLRTIPAAPRDRVNAELDDMV